MGRALSTDPEPADLTRLRGTFRFKDRGHHRKGRDLREVAPGLRYWTAPHPQWRGATEWPEEVGCVCFEAADAGRVDRSAAATGQGSVVSGGARSRRRAPRSTGRGDAHGTLAQARRCLDRGTLRHDGVGTPGRIRPGRALVVAELLMGIDGGLRVCPPPALQDRAAFEASLQTLLRWSIDHVLVSHGEPVIGNGGRQINDALQAFAET